MLSVCQRLAKPGAGGLQFVRRASLSLGCKNVLSTTSASELWNVTLTKPDTRSVAVANILQQLSRFEHIETSSTSGQDSTDLAEAESSLLGLVHFHFLPEISELVPYFDAPGKCNGESRRLSSRLVRSAWFKSLPSQAEIQSKESQAAIRSALIGISVEHIAENCQFWPADLVVKSLHALVTLNCTSQHAYRALFSCLRLDLPHVVSALNAIRRLKANAACPLARREGCAVLQQMCDSAMRAGDGRATLRPLSSLADMGDDQYVRHVAPALLALLTSDSRHGDCQLMDVLRVVRLMLQKQCAIKHDSMNMIVSHFCLTADSAPVSDHVEVVQQLASMVMFRPFHDALKELLVRPLTCVCVKRISRETDWPRTPLLMDMLRLAHFLRWAEQCCVSWLPSKLLASTAVQLDATWMVTVSFFLANLKCLPKGVVANVWHCHQDNLHFDQHVKLALVSAMCGEFLQPMWESLLQRMDKEELSTSLRQFSAFCLLVVEAFISSVYLSHGVRCRLLPSWCHDVAMGKCSSQWQSSYKGKFMVSLHQFLKPEHIWKTNPSRDFFFISGLAAVVVDGEGNLVPRQARFDSEAMYPIYFVQGRLHGSGMLDGLQQLFCRMSLCQSGFCIQIKNGQADDASLSCLKSVQHFVKTLESSITEEAMSSNMAPLRLLSY